MHTIGERSHPYREIQYKLEVIVWLGEALFYSAKEPIGSWRDEGKLSRSGIENIPQILDFCPLHKGVVTRPCRHFFISFHHIFAHNEAMVQAYTSKCSPLNLLSNGMFQLAMHVFVYILKVVM